MVNFLLIVTMALAEFKYRILWYSLIIGLNKIKSQFSLVTMFKVLMMFSN